MTAGDPAAAATYAAFRVNDRTTTLRLVVENPDEQLAAEDFGDAGALYKSLATGRFTYRGEDPLQYETSFRQVSGNNDQDLQPLIDFIKWVNEVDDAGFDAGLAQRLEVESFARYVAWQNLLSTSTTWPGRARTTCCSTTWPPSGSRSARGT